MYCPVQYNQVFAHSILFKYDIVPQCAKLVTPDKSTFMLAESAIHDIALKHSLTVFTYVHTCLYNCMLV